MSSTATIRLLKLEEVQDRLSVDSATLEYLLSTGQLPEIRIRGTRLIDERDLAKLIETYKRVQRRSNDGHE